MRARRFLLIGTLAMAACASDAITGMQQEVTAADKPHISQQATLTGYVVLYESNEVRLLTDGREILLLGSSDLVVPYGGSLVTVSGQFVDADSFWVFWVVGGSYGHPVT